MASLPFLVVHGGWLWPVVGAIFAGVAGVIVWRMGQARRINAEAARLGPRPRGRFIDPALAVVAAGLFYYGACWTVGSAFLEQSQTSEGASSRRWAQDPPAVTRLTLAAATPKRKAALERLMGDTGPSAVPEALSLRHQLMRMLGYCESIARELATMSRFEDALRQARSCRTTPSLLQIVRGAHLGLGQLDEAAAALEREVELTGSWKHSDVALLAMTRRWEALEKAATSRAKESPEDADEWTCVALGARHRRGDASALADLRARPVRAATIACRIIAADATGAIEDLQAIAPAPVTLGPGPIPAPPPAPRGDLRERLIRYARGALGDGPVDDTPALYAFTTALVIQDADAPRAHELKATSLDEVRGMVLAIHAPADLRNLVWVDVVHTANTDAWATLGDGIAPRSYLGLHLRAIRALLPARASGLQTGELLAELLPLGAAVMAHGGHHDIALAYLETALELDRSIPRTADPEDARRTWRLRPLINASIVVLLRAGRFEDAIAVHDALGDFTHDEDLDRCVALARGTTEEGEALFSGSESDPTDLAFRTALAGSGDGFAQLESNELINSHRQLPLIARHLEEGKAPVTELLRTYPSDTDRVDDAFATMGWQLHLAESLGEVDAASRLRTQLDTMLDAMVADDTSVLVAIASALN